MYVSCCFACCRFYGAVAMFERTAECQIPLRERRQHNLHFDLTAYGADSGDVDGHQGFSLKIFGTSRHRYLTLVIPKCETPLVKALRVVLDRSVSVCVHAREVAGRGGEGDFARFHGHQREL